MGENALFQCMRKRVHTLVLNTVLVLIYICMKVLIATPLVIVVVVDAVKIIFSFSPSFQEPNNHFKPNVTQFMFG